MAVLDQVARDALPMLRPLLSESAAALFAEYVNDGEPILGLEQVLLSLVEAGTVVPPEALAQIEKPVRERAAEGGDVIFLLEPLGQLERST